jgi:aarF domain-containing kinase
MGRLTTTFVSFSSAVGILKSGENCDKHSVFKSEHKMVQESSAWICDVLNLLKILLRTIKLAILLTPLVLSAPIAIYFDSSRDPWFRLLVKTIQICGPVYVKLGQWASTRRDLFDPRLCQNLSTLQKQAKTHSWSHTAAILLENYDINRGDIFQDFDKEPIGSGCCAQVYKAKINLDKMDDRNSNLESRAKDGQVEVAVKVLHPNVKENFLQDLTVLRYLVRGASWLFPQLEWLSVKESLEEFAKLMNVQVDLRNEAFNLSKFKTNFKDDLNVIFPTPILHFCSHNIIVETFEEGIHIGNLLQDVEQVPIKNRESLASKGVDMLLQMVFRHNFVHADLHPGNILVRSDDKLVILDPGLTATLLPKDLLNFRAVFTAVVQGDGQEVGRQFLQQSEQECQNPQQFILDMEQIVVDARRSRLSLAKVDVTYLLTRVFNVLQSHRVKLDPNFVSVILSIMVLEGLGRTLDPDLDLLWAAVPYLLTK